MRITLSGWISIPVASLLLVFFCSCGNTRQMTYIQGAFDTTKLSQVSLPDPMIQKGDILNIIVYSDNPEATKIFNQELITTATPGGAGGAGGAGASGGGIVGNSPSTPGYLVDENGNIEFQELGLLHVVGLTRGQLKDTLAVRLAPFLKNVYFTVRFLNYRFTMLGEINRPGVFSFPSDNLNLFEALGMAGDMTFYGRRDNILVIRETSGVRTFARLDITKPDIITSPYFYLHQNDVVIFEASSKKIAANDQVTLRNITIATTFISVFAILYGIFH
jgi:polysaccharide biosynthesis/export protein